MIRLAVRRPVGTVVAWAALAAGGGWQLARMPSVPLPTTTARRLVVTADWPRGTPESIEAIATSRIEAAARRVEGVEPAAPVGAGRTPRDPAAMGSTEPRAGAPAQDGVPGVDPRPVRPRTGHEPDDRIPDHLSPSEAAEAREILDALSRARYNRQDAAKILGISRTTLWRKMKEYRL